jgi:hypothetical protein
MKYCPCCGYDFKNKDYKKESKKLLKRYDNKTKDLIVNTFSVVSKFESVTEQTIYMFLQGISKIPTDVVFEGLKIYYKKSLNKSGKGLNYLKGIIFNVKENEKKYKEILDKTIGVVPEEFPDEHKS